MYDRSISAYHGKNAEAGALKAFREAIKDGRVRPGSVLIIEALDRATRQKPKEGMKVIREILDAGVRIAILNPTEREFDIESENRLDDVLILQLALVGANDYSENHSRRVGAAWARKKQAAAETGKLLTTLVPSWFKRDQAGKLVLKNGKPVPDSEKAKRVNRVFRLAAKGIGRYVIAR